MLLTAATNAIKANDSRCFGYKFMKELFRPPTLDIYVPSGAFDGSQIDAIKGSDSRCFVYKLMQELFRLLALDLYVPLHVVLRSSHRCLYNATVDGSQRSFDAHVALLPIALNY